MKIQGDIYSMAYAALMDPEQLQHHHANLDGFLQPIKLTKQEFKSLFFGACMVICTQATVLYLVVDQMMQPSFTFLPQGEFIICIPRLISTVLMHMVVEPEIRSGINLMKYAVNQPHMFRGSLNKDTNQINASRVLPAFMLGFFQSLMAFFVEYVIVCYLSSMTNLIVIFMKFAALT